MPRKKKTKRKKGVPVRIRLLIGVLIAFVVAGVVLVKYLQTPAGQTFLLDQGFDDYYEQVQLRIDIELRQEIRRLGLRESLDESTRSIALGKRDAVMREWRAAFERPRSLIRVNVALTEAVRRGGGVVRSSKENKAGDGIVLDVGSRKYTTHRLRIEQPRKTSAEPKRPERPRPDKPRVAIVIDDFGYTRDRVARGLIEIDLPITLSIIPTLAYTGYCLERAAEVGKLAILHLPMEAGDFTSDVPAVMTSMSDEQIDSLVTAYVSGMPGVAGVNNHLGSTATQDERVMTAVMNVLKPRGLFYFDSLTSAKSIAYNTARQMGVRAARNDLFIDADTEEPDVVSARLERLVDIAHKRGYAIGIGHPRRWTLEAVQAFADGIAESDVEVVFLSELVE
jgi:polysaccharide deacetylase 2 family uncharacterized protein YibQ